MSQPAIKALFLDLGGVFLTNGWDRNSRQKAAEAFSLDFADMNERHRIIFDAYEAGKMTLVEYVNLLVFHQQRDFTPQQFIDFMYEESAPYQDMIDLVCRLKKKYNLRTVAVNNEGRELNEYRIDKFGLTGWIDIFASSCFVHTRKPDKDIYLSALDLSQVKPDEVVYIDDRKVFTEAAAALGIRGIHHTKFETTKQALAGFGLIETL
jgi:putative hydrolase of the HAD superfamily